MDNQNNVQNYDASQIQVLEGLEAVRKRPGMYIGSSGPKGLHHLVYEIVDNSIDEALAGYCDKITVEILPGNVIRVSDDGRGIPVGIHPKEGISAATVVFTVLHAGGKFGGSGYKVSGGLHGVGASVVNALSEWLEVNICDGKHEYFQRFERGAYSEELKVIGDTDKTGTTVTFKADDTIFETTEYEYETLLDRLRQQAFLNAGIHIEISDKRKDEIVEESLCYEGGIRSYVEHLQNERNYKTVHENVIYLTETKGDSIVEIALQYNESDRENLLSFANNIRTIDGGSHEIGFRTALTRVFNNYGRRYKILKDADKDLEGNDVREGLTVVISVKLTECEFEGQTKGKLGNPEVRPFVYQMVLEKLTTYFEENPAVTREIFEKALTAQKAREAAKRARESVRKSALKDGGLKLPGKLADCTDKNPKNCEVYIVEGDSAGGSAKQGRDRRFQAILPLWGKMLNVQKAREDKVYDNEKLLPVVTALGAGIGEDFNPEKLRYDRVIIMADADVDGSHIRVLLLTFFFKFMRPLIEGGHVYLAQPPLYKLSRGKKETHAYSDAERDEQMKAFMAEGSGKVEIQRYKGLGEMNPKQLWETTMDPERRIMKRVEMEDAEKAATIFEILMGDKVEPRREFIEKNAKYVSNLDI